MEATWVSRSTWICYRNSRDSCVKWHIWLWRAEFFRSCVRLHSSRSSATHSTSCWSWAGWSECQHSRSLETNFDYEIICPEMRWLTSQRFSVTVCENSTSKRERCLPPWRILSIGTEAGTVSVPGPSGQIIQQRLKIFVQLTWVVT